MPGAHDPVPARKRRRVSNSAVEQHAQPAQRRKLLDTPPNAASDVPPLERGKHPAKRRARPAGSHFKSKHSHDLENEDTDSESSVSSIASEVGQHDTIGTTPNIETKLLAHLLCKTERRVHAAVKKARNFEALRIIKRLKNSGSLKDSGSGKKTPLQSSGELEEELQHTKTADIDAMTARVICAKMIKMKMLPRSAEVKRHQFNDQAVSSADGMVAWPNAILEAYPVLTSLSAVPSLAMEHSRTCGLSPAADISMRSPLERRAMDRLASSTIVSERCCDLLNKVSNNIQKQRGCSTIAIVNDVAQDGVNAKAASTPAQSEPVQKGLDYLLSREWSGSECADGDSLLEGGEEGDDESKSEEGGLIAGDREEAGDGNAFDPSVLDDTRWDALVASGSESGSGDEVGEVHAERKKAHGARTDNGDDETSNASDGSSSEEDEGGAKSSAFLPSLAAGYVGKPMRLGVRNSDSEWSDAEEELMNAGSDIEVDASGKKRKVSKERKNRMGQRARKALWEKKYGRGAHHIQLQHKEQRIDEKLKERREKWASGGNTTENGVQQRAWGKQKAGSKSRTERRPFHQRDAGSDGAMAKRGPYPGTQKTSAQPVVSKPIDGNSKAKQQDMHPSWVAKQKQKEMLALASRPQGKKITFD
ncbi:BUD22-domain-containing protein [Tilletiaria anomala UBC 951]|uniref:BUD22-domain-containing protein n=1 Tax=Tilletiaria anomala (strain ATCC 24038 / CBS 436.72 / UBC 951) TaxID=1037660 RepID=A0A066VW26_TILAU|nr:BUD22-domain-containing protein [Tilletiaria anomala UBC 951]KDN45897.1 BUD22-domain-containing protein [Tilletiaria anomala UBC 951]